MHIYLLAMLSTLSLAAPRADCDEPVLTLTDVNGPCEGCPTARTPEEVEAVNVEYDSRLFLNERNRYLCTEDYPSYRDKCYHYWVVGRYDIECGRANRFEPGSAERKAADARVKVVMQEVIQLGDQW